LWLSGISTTYRAYVNYYTTTYKLWQFFGDYRNLAANVILQWPNDGVSNQKRERKKTKKERKKRKKKKEEEKKTPHRIDQD
jgi:hypothetical protein